ncbi:hypothetical protein C8R43DRAFT_901417 [Mycena crocata]|nr:hypothetical protein C8R43DRAFT_901417 [Mycena crocata]
MASTTTTLPKTLPPTLLESSPKLSAEQAGHIRHFHNLSSTISGEWTHMGSQLAGQEWLDSYRYQLAAMAYATGVAHYHRLPALRSVFKTLLEQLITKMMHRDVWSYWYLTSQSGRLVDPDIQELRKPWSNPVVQENIMYSGHLLLMVSLHAMLFDDDKYDAPDALVFEWNPIFWGMGPEKFSYTRSSLQDAIIKEMERQNWMGVCCEPNNVFIIAIRYNDVRNGTNVVEGVLQKYTAAWRAKNGGFQQNDGLFVDWILVKQDRLSNARSLGFTAWQVKAGAFMNSWNSDEVKSLYPSQAVGFLHKIPEEGRINLHSPGVAWAIRALVKDEGADPEAPTTLEKARKSAAPAGGPPRADFGYITQWASEVADEATVDGLLRHADMFLRPTWDRGGLFYPRHDQHQDAAGNWTLMEPYSGNGAIGYGRLNVHDGQKTMWAKPWDRAHFSIYPYVEGIDLASGVDFLRGAWDAERGAMILTVRTWDGASKSWVLFLLITPIFRNLPAGTYRLYVNGDLTEVKTIASRNDLVKVPLAVAGDELDVVLLREALVV